MHSTADAAPPWPDGQSDSPALTARISDQAPDMRARLNPHTTTATRRLPPSTAPPAPSADPLPYARESTRSPPPSACRSSADHARGRAAYTRRGAANPRSARCRVSPLRAGVHPRRTPAVARLMMTTDPIGWRRRSSGKNQSSSNIPRKASSRSVSLTTASPSPHTDRSAAPKDQPDRNRPTHCYAPRRTQRSPRQPPKKHRISKIRAGTSSPWPRLTTAR